MHLLSFIIIRTYFRDLLLHCSIVSVTRRFKTQSVTIFKLGENPKVLATVGLELQVIIRILHGMLYKLLFIIVKLRIENYK